jgi:hypothetical protein
MGPDPLLPYHAHSFFFFLVVQGFEFRTSLFLGKGSSTSATPLAPFALVIFQIGSHLFFWADLGGDALIYTSLIAGMKGVCHHAQLGL